MATLHNYITLTTWLKLWQEVVFDILEIVISTWNQGVTEQAQAEAMLKYEKPNSAHQRNSTNNYVEYKLNHSHL